MEFAARQIQGFWPDAQVQPSDDYTIFNSQGAVKAAYLKGKNHYSLPIRTFTEIGIDTFLPILSNFSKLEMASEGLAMQILARPAHESAKKSVYEQISKLKKGAKFSEVLGGSGWDIKGALFPKEKTKEEKAEQIVVDEEAVKSLTAKVL